MRSHKEVPSPGDRNASVYYCTVFDVVLMTWICSFCVRWIKAGVMSLDYDDARDLWLEAVV